MTITTLSSREFNQDANEGYTHAQPAQEPPSQKITNDQIGIVELLSTQNVADIDFEPQRLYGKLYRPADLA